MTALVDIIEDLKHLPSQDLEQAAHYIHQLREARREHRRQPPKLLQVE